MLRVLAPDTWHLKPVLLRQPFTAAAIRPIMERN